MPHVRSLVALVLPVLLGALVFAGEGKRPPSKDGSDLLGTAMPDVAFERWIGTAGGKPLEAGGHPVLYRWWTNGCSLCEASLRAVEPLREEYEPKGLRVVAVYHPKPVRDVTDDAIRQAAEKVGYGGVVAVDADCSELQRVWLDAGRGPGTSVMFLVDADRVIRFVHPGGAIFPSDDPKDAEENKSFEQLRRAVAEVTEPAPKD